MKVCTIVLGLLLLIAGLGFVGSPEGTHMAQAAVQQTAPQEKGKTLAEVLQEQRSKDPTRKKIADAEDLVIDVVTREFDILHFTVGPKNKTITAENVSTMPVNFFKVEFNAAHDEGGLSQSIEWGCTTFKDPPLKPGETVTIPIDLNIMQENGKNFLFMQLEEAYANNDLTTKYSYGAVLKQDPLDPRRYKVIVNAKGRKKGPDGQFIDEPHQHPR